MTHQERFDAFGGDWRSVQLASELHVGDIISGPLFVYFWQIIGVLGSYVVLNKYAPESAALLWRATHVHAWMTSARADTRVDLCICGARLEDIHGLLPSNGMTRAFVHTPGADR